MLAMSLYPEVQARARAEVDAVIGPGRFPNIDDRGFDKMPYLEATVLECIRWHPPAQSLIPHLPLTDDTYRGYFIPKGTTVLGNVWYVLLISACLIPRQAVNVLTCSIGK